MLFDLAYRLVREGSANLFVTGKAGTGKTTFLKRVRDHCDKQLVVVAPTGVAAINAGGVTIHSFFQLPLAAYIPEGPGFSRERDEFVNAYTLLSRQRLDTDKRTVMQELQLLIIDEISMVRADTLDMIDMVLRHVRNRPDQPFGGVQVLFIGDLYQLPPVMRDDTWSTLQEFYRSPFFFDSRALAGAAPLYIEFEKVYRQSDAAFIDLLNQIRHGALTADGLALLDSRLDPDFQPGASGGFVTLSTHNDSVRLINERELNALSTELSSFEAEIKGDFPENASPADKLLQLKPGAQVMFIRNDPDRARRFYNGKLATVVSVEEEEVLVSFADGSDQLKVRREKWENIRYSVNEKTRNVEEEVMGSYAQFPLKLAWAITVHKSQGLTFQKLVIDAARSFVPGQAYVALSRCTSLGGLVLTSPIRPASLRVDPRIVAFAARSATLPQLRAALLESGSVYAQELLLETFDLRLALAEFGKLADDVRQMNVDEASRTWTDALLSRVNAEQDVALRFQQWLRTAFSAPIPDFVAIAARVAGASAYFTGRMNSILQQLKDCPVTSGNRLHARSVTTQLKECFGVLALRVWLIEFMKGIPDADAYHTHRKAFQVSAFAVNVFRSTGEAEDEVVHPRLYGELKAKRDELAMESKLPVYMVANARSLLDLCRYLPQELNDLERISGFGANRASRFGTVFLEIITAYCDMHGLQSQMHALPAGSKRKRKAGS